MATKKRSVTRRLPAEWEPQARVQFTFPHEDSDWKDDLERATTCFVDMISAVARFQKVLIVCDEVARVRSFLKKIPSEQLQFAEIPSNDTWARDHGGISIFENGERLVLDFGFNGWGLKFAADRDNLITKRLFEKGFFKNQKRKLVPLILEGGSIESDGDGTILTTENCLLSPNRNPHLSKRQIENQLKKWLGAERILWLQHGHLIGDDTDAHIDTLARFCDLETICYVQCTDKNDPHFESLQKMEAGLKQFKTKNGQPYRLIPLPIPTACFAKDGHQLPATYANFLIINQAVLVPVYGLKEDDQALQQLQKCFPDRQIIPIDCRILIEQHGSLHCVSMQYPGI